MCPGLAGSASERRVNACNKKRRNFNASFITYKAVFSPVSQPTQLLNDFGPGVFETHLARPVPLQLAAALQHCA